jgi:hypothetical protein
VAVISRRSFLQAGMGLCGGLLFRPPPLAEGADFPQFFLSQVRYRGGEWDPNPSFAEAIIEELEMRTSVRAARERRIITLSDPNLFFCPFLYMAGKYEFDPFTPEERETLRRYLSFGGFLFAEDVLGSKGYGFDAAFRREMKLIFPRFEIKRLPSDHSLFQSFYVVQSIGGRQRVNPYLEGITIDQWTPVVYSQNDLSGAWARDRFGKWQNDCIPGGEAQRSAAFKLGINIMVYSLTGNYKKDLLHHPFITRRRNQ